MALDDWRPSLPVRIPGTYRPQQDTALLARSLHERGLAAGRSVLDVCTGTGALALAAAEAGAASVAAVDLSRRSVLSARLNAAVRQARLEVLRGDLFAPVRGRRFDLVLSNPPYVPAPTDQLPRFPMARCWDGGTDGRALVDRICDGVAHVLAPGGTFLLTHSAVTGVDQTLTRLRSRGLAVDVVARERIPFGPVMRERADLLVARGLIDPDENTEEIVLVEATLPVLDLRESFGAADVLASDAA